MGVSRQSVLRWARAMEAGGINALRSRGRTGPKPALSDADCRRLAMVLKEGPSAHGFVTELWTAKRVGLLIKSDFGVRLSEAQTWRVLRERLGWSPQRPARRAREQDAQAVAHWKRYT
jgi:transposase